MNSELWWNVTKNLWNSISITKQEERLRNAYSTTHNLPCRLYSEICTFIWFVCSTCICLLLLPVAFLQKSLWEDQSWLPLGCQTYCTVHQTYCTVHHTWLEQGWTQHEDEWPKRVKVGAHWTRCKIWVQKRWKTRKFCPHCGRARKHTHMYLITSLRV